MLQPPVRGFNRDALSRLRQAAGLTHAELGLRADVAPSVLHRWESGAASRAQVLADTLKVSVPELVAAYKRGAIRVLQQRIDELESMPVAATA
jgi:transcriptional regulator with XRE-family HTH domain